MLTKEIKDAFSSFFSGVEIIGVDQITTGLINATYLLTTEDGRKYVLQKINTYVFKRPDQLMDNIVSVTKHLRKKIEAAGGNTEKETLNFIRNSNGTYYYTDSNGAAWRMYKYVDDSFTYNRVEDGDTFRSAGNSFGRFMRLLSDFPADTLYETIANFHNTPSRYADFISAVETDAVGRRAEVEDEIRFVVERKADTGVLIGLLEEGRIPLRVTHNDTKLNNVLFDTATNKSICVIDLDTVMPGLSLYDFGDTIRSGANTSNEDESDLSKVLIDLDLFEKYVDGYLSETADSLKDDEINNLAFGAKLMTFECGIRFLTDYLNGDLYFRTNYPGHNLVRARNQFALVKNMELNMDKMEAIVARYKELYRNAEA